MDEIVISSSSLGPVLKEAFAREIDQLDRVGFQVAIDERQVEGETRIFCRCDCEDPTAQEIMRYVVCRVLRTLILEHFEPLWVSSQLTQRDQKMTAAESIDLAEKVKASLVRAGRREDTPRERIASEILDYISCSSTINLEGFAMFRLRDYQRQIAQVCADTVAAWVALRERQEFIALLQCFMAAQEFHVDRVEILLLSNGSFRLIDESGEELDDRYLETFVSDLVTGSVNHADLLISALITLAPRVVRCHYRTEQPVVKTLRDVFGRRVSFCRGCRVCDRGRCPVPKA